MGERVEIYTDGACSGNPGPGGWGALLRLGEKEKELCGGEAETTNNRMELTAAIEALNALKRACEIDLYTDSQYVKGGVTGWMHNWKRNGWKTAAKSLSKMKIFGASLMKLIQRHDIKWHWVKGHAGHEGNERADQLANKGMAPFK